MKHNKTQCVDLIVEKMWLKIPTWHSHLALDRERYASFKYITKVHKISLSMSKWQKNPHTNGQLKGAYIEYDR